MNIIFRTDASVDRGSGHVMRCLTLADELKRRGGANISFISREEKGNSNDFIQKKGYAVYPLPSGIDIESDKNLTLEILGNQPSHFDWLIIDHYEIDTAWEFSFRKLVKRIMVIDDLANRQHNCDLILDQNYNQNKDRYKDLVSKHCIQLLGSKYALLQPQFDKELEKLEKQTGEVKRILVFMGTGDSTNQTSKVLRAIKMLERPEIETDVVIGSSNTHRKEIESLASSMSNTKCYFNSEHMAKLMAASDLSIGAGGTASWERCCLGLPTLVIDIAENQVGITQELSEGGFLIRTGWYQNVSDQTLLADLKFMLRHPEILRRISLKVKQLVDGKGVKRVANHLLDDIKSISLRLAVPDDCDRILKWRNNPDVRRYSLSSVPLSLEEHKQWFLKTLSLAEVVLLIGENKDGPVGVLRYNLKDKKAIVSIYLVPHLSGMGLGNHMLRLGNKWIKNNNPEINQIIAKIKHNNIASKEAFRKAGFTKSYLAYVFDLKSSSH